MGPFQGEMESIFGVSLSLALIPKRGPLVGGRNANYFAAAAARIVT